MSKPIKSIPLNLNTGTCNPQSSNCIIWQGPAIPCLNICKGASITQVIYDIAIQFCNMYEMLDPLSYNTECLDINLCGDASFKDLFQALIDRVCFLEAGGCNVIAEIFKGSETQFSANMINGVAPITYQWSIAQTDRIGGAISGSTTNSIVTIAYNTVSYVAGEDPDKKINQILLKVVMTDKNGCLASDVLLINRLRP